MQAGSRRQASALETYCRRQHAANLNNTPQRVTSTASPTPNICHAHAHTVFHDSLTLLFATKLSRLVHCGAGVLLVCNRSMYAACQVKPRQGQRGGAVVARPGFALWMPPCCQRRHACSEQRSKVCLTAAAFSARPPLPPSLARPVNQPTHSAYWQPARRALGALRDERPRPRGPPRLRPYIGREDI